MLYRFEKFAVSVFFADGWEVYAGLFFAEIFGQTKVETCGIEWNSFG